MAKKTTTPAMNINTNKINAQIHPTVMQVAENIQLLTGVALPDLKLTEVETLSFQLYQHQDLEQMAVDALLNNDPESAKQHIRDLTLERKKNHHDESEVDRYVITKAEQAAKEQDAPKLKEYIIKNLDAARESFNKAAQQFSDAWAADDVKQTDSMLPVIGAGLHLFDALEKHFEYRLPIHAHRITINNFYPREARELPAFMDTRTEHSRLIDLMNAQGRPGKQVRLYWKDAAEFETENEEFTKMLEEIGQLDENDIKIYEYWLTHNGK